jgi:hypothetical protein
MSAGRRVALIGSPEILQEDSPEAVLADIEDLPGIEAAAPDNDEDADTFDGDQLVIHELIVGGAPAAAARHWVEQGGKADECVRRMRRLAAWSFSTGPTPPLCRRSSPKCAARG